MYTLNNSNIVYYLKIYIQIEVSMNMSIVVQPRNCVPKKINNLTVNKNYKFVSKPIFLVNSATRHQ